MNIRDRLEAVIDFARNVPRGEVSDSQIAEILDLLDEVCENPELRAEWEG